MNALVSPCEFSSSEINSSVDNTLMELTKSKQIEVYFIEDDDGFFNGKCTQFPTIICSSKNYQETVKLMQNQISDMLDHYHLNPNSFNIDYKLNYL